MNLRVDLILETEQRSASVVNLKGLIRIVTIVVPLILLLIITMSVMAMSRISSELKALEADIAIAVPKKDAAIAYRDELAKNRQALEELEGWRKSRIDWADELMKLHRIIPAEIQITTLRISDVIETVDGVPARIDTVFMRGKAFGPQARANVESLGETHHNPAFTNFIKTASVADYKKNEDPSARDGEMLFQIDAAYKPRKFK